MSSSPAKCTTSPDKLDRELNKRILLNPPTQVTKALFIGINYDRDSGRLEGCVNDVNNKFKWISKFSKLDKKNTIFLIDDTSDLVQSIFDVNKEFTILPPTRANISKYHKWVTEGIEPGQMVFVHYSGQTDACMR